MAHPNAAVKPVHILCSAIWYNDGKKRTHSPKNVEAGIVACGLRHCNCFTILAAIYPDLDYMKQPAGEPRKTIQGFLTSEGKFVDRLEGAEIAFAAGQIDKPLKKLHSEDLW